MGDLYGGIITILSDSPVLVFVADMCITVSVVILFLLLIRPVMKKLPRMGMYVLWFAVLIRMLCPVTIRGIYHIVPEPFEQKMSRVIHGQRLEYEALQRKNETNVYNAGRENRRMSRQKEAFDHGLVAAQGDVQAGDELPEALNDSQPEGARESGQLQGEENSPAAESAVKAAGMEEHGMHGGMADILVVLWGAGVLCCAGVLAVSFVRTWRKYRDAALCFGNVYTHPLVESPFVGGIISPKIYVPEQMEEKDRRYVLCHEQVHVRRRDYLVKPVAFLAFSLLWFNPLVWVAYHLMMRDMEISCDEMAVRNFSTEEKREYSNLLLGMTVGKKRYLSQNPAFSAGVVRERILSVMKSKRPTKIVTAVAVAAVILCSCGIASEPERSQDEASVDTVVEKNMGQTDEICYVEQSFSFPGEDFEAVKGYSTTVSSIVMDSHGNIVQFADLWKKPDDSSYKYAKLRLEDGEWVREEAPWLEKQINEKIKEKNYMLDNYWYGADGQLYMQVSEMSMNVAKFFKMKVQSKKEDMYYLKQTHLFKINEETNEMVEINIPRKSVKEAVAGGEIQEPDIMLGNGKGIVPYTIQMFSDGNLLIESYYTNEIGVYSSVTGERLADLKGIERGSSRLLQICAGNGFFAYGVLNYDSGKLDILVVGEDGELQNTIPTEFEYKRIRDSGEETDDLLGLHVCGDEIILVADHCIYEAGPDSDAFTNVVNEEKDELFYLPQDKYTVLSVAGKDAEGRYTLMLMPNEASGQSNMKVCRYEKKDTNIDYAQ